MHLSYLGPASCVFDCSYSPGLLSSHTGVGGGWQHLLHHRHCFCFWESSCTFGGPRWWLWHFCLLIWKEIFHFTCLWNALFQGAWNCGPALGSLLCTDLFTFEGPPPQLQRLPADHLVVLFLCPKFIIRPGPGPAVLEFMAWEQWPKVIIHTGHFDGSDLCAQELEVEYLGTD